uniref:Uncharacterized protein n=1 Tax=Meloidogyne enterolobii TaxID=390850 RepID=A0A6V7UFK7_MELEN|nr:unnamed protein product [Meloidogyne enterolobii]
MLVEVVEVKEEKKWEEEKDFVVFVEANPVTRIFFEKGRGAREGPMKKN